MLSLVSIRLPTLFVFSFSGILFSFSLFFFVYSLFATSSLAFGNNDPSIDGDLRKTIQANMPTFIDRNTIDGVYSIYDPIDGKLMQLSLVELHEGIVKKSNDFVSFADFIDFNQKIVDLDFMVIPAGGCLQVTQGEARSGQS